MSFSLPFLATAIALSSAAVVQPDPVGGEADSKVQDEVHHDHGDEIVVTGVRRKAGDVLGGLSVLDAEELAREIRPSLGETLARQPGVSASSFGPAASRPILRGLSGDRIRVLTDGIGSFDVSSSSPDHAVAINPLTADRIEVLRGPAALLYGSSAIGGVVNVIDRRIPRRQPVGAIGANALVEYATAASERNANLSFDLPLGAGFIVHSDGNWLRSDELRTGGHLLTRSLREEAAASPDPDIRDLARLRGQLPNSAARSWELAGGIAYVDGPMNVGASVTKHDALYGVPVRFSLDPDSEAEAPIIDVRQTRYDARAELPLEGLLSQVRLRAGYANYRHDEIEEGGEIGSTFRTKGGEGRAELVQTERSGWGGTSGVQFFTRKVSIVGEEKFLPDAQQAQTGLFTMQSLLRGPWRLEAGLRVEFSKLDAKEDQELGTPGLSRNFRTVSGSVGAAYDIADGWRAGINLSHSARAPSIDELFANGPHAGTQAFEIGNPGLDPERSVGMEGSIRRHGGPIQLTATAYLSRFSNFIFQAATGEIEDDLPVFAYREGKARYYGFELEATADLGNALGVHWDVDMIADYVHAKVKDFGPAPQIPPLRLLGGVSANGGPLEGRLEVEHAFRQPRNAPFETETDGHTLVSASLRWKPFVNQAVTFGLAANNLFDVVARRHSSLLKDYAPLAGRDVRLTASLGL